MPMLSGPRFRPRVGSAWRHLPGALLLMSEEAWVSPQKTQFSLRLRAGRLLYICVLLNPQNPISRGFSGFAWVSPDKIDSRTSAAAGGCRDLLSSGSDGLGLVAA